MKAIIFDFGGTLDTDGVHWSEFFWDVYKRFSVGVSKEEYERAYVEGENDMSIAEIVKWRNSEKPFRNVLVRQLSNQFKHLGSPDVLRGNDNGKELRGEKLIEKMADYCYYESKECLKKSKEILSELKKNFKLGVISNFYGNMAEVCKEFGIFEFLDVIIDSAVVGVSKPDPAIFKLTLKELNVDAADCLMVGDSYSRDIEPAKSTGCKTVWLRGKSWNEPKDFSKADFVIGSLGEIMEIVK